MRAPRENRLDYEGYFLREECFIWRTRLLQADFHDFHVFIEIYKTNVLFCQQAPQEFCRIDKSTRVEALQCG